ncbi:SDR family oxidoreductase [Robertkochia solimangrovi]|uniref:SDR family oxidoreductase n=1 Tax=Robertkochia solimangrovi TaxID=2213046 RepID=UPI00117F934C|nr:SDR family oxidoreductase [Robertkochia solimangrovi]TRZ41297.1 SDR family NAD(P)-dependent oxidoreductase [Robertkochia solimangrovi]
MILITGANGNLGSAVIKHLLKTTEANEIAGLVRSQEKGKELKALGIQIRTGSYDDVESLKQAMQGVDKVLLISGLDQERFQQHKNVIDAAVSQGVAFIAYTSVSMKDPESTVNTFMKSHFQTETYIIKSGLSYAILRDNLYMDAIPMFAGEQVFEKGIYLPAGDGKVSFALRDEMAEGIANVLTSEIKENKIYEISGAEAYSFGDIASTLSELSGKKVAYVNADKKEYEALLTSVGLPDFVKAMVSAFATDISKGQHETIFPDLEKLLGRKPTGLKAALSTLYGF